MQTFNYKHYYNLMKANDRFANHPVAFYKRAIKNNYGEEVKNREVYDIEVMCDATKKESTKKLMKDQYNRGLARDLVSLPEVKVYKFVERVLLTRMSDGLLRENLESCRLSESARPNFKRNMLLHSFLVLSNWTCLLILAKISD